MTSNQLVYGRRAAESFLRTPPAGASRELVEVWLQDSLPAALRDLARERAETSGAALQELPRRELDRRFPELRHQGVVLVLRAGAADADSESARGDWRRRIQPDANGKRSGLYVLLDRMQDVHNVGSIIRSAEALGAAAVFVTGKGAPLSDAVHRVSAGASLRLPVFRESNLANVTDTLKKHGYWICASAAPADFRRRGEPSAPAAIRADRAAYGNLPPTEDLALIIGSEGDGVKRLALERADFLLQIELAGETESLNAGVAAGILLDRLLNR